jgi:hypothetical protein
VTWGGDPETPAGGGTAAASPLPAGTSGEHAREQWRAALRLTALERNRRKSGRHRRTALPARAGMNRIPLPPEPDGGDAA